MKKKQIKVKFWIWGPITVYYNKTYAQIFFLQKSLHPTCEAMRQVKKQQIKVKIWIWGPGTVNYNMTYAQAFFQKSLHPIIHGHAHTYYLLRGVCHEMFYLYSQRCDAHRGV